MKILLLIVFLINSIIYSAVQLKGKVYDENSNTVKNLTIRFASLGTVVTTNSGEFIIEIPDGLRSAEIELTDNNLKIVYPIDKRIAVPSDPEFISKIVIGKRATGSASVNDLVTKYKKLEALLGEIGVAQNDMRSLMEDFIKKESEDVNVEEEKLKSALYKEKRNEKFTQISAAILKYNLKAQNILNAFKNVSGFAFTNQNALAELADNVKQYNISFNEINNNKLAYRGDVSLFWGDKKLSDDLYEIYNYAVEEIHKPYILALNEEITEINKIITNVYEDDEKERMTKSVNDEISYSVRELQIKLPVLDRKIMELLTKLQQDM